ncbi:MAG TPA: GspH/FimT family pseudopilin [Steroidobacteraceae bacterium]|nr:GspH/FimT family pseudopilin [Steroidobacteraceae bacterium]
MKGQTGFTVTELLMAMVVMAILLSISVPSYRYITNSYRLSAEVNSLLGDLQYARAEALREGQTVTVCVSADGATCAGTVNWQSGWVIFSNPTNAANPPAGSILRLQSRFTGGPDTFVASNGVTTVSYNREGFALGVAGTVITLHDPTNSPVWTRCLLLFGPGLARTAMHQASPATCGP